MKFWRSVMQLPQPVKGCLMAYMIVFGVAFVSVPLMALAGKEHAVTVAPWTMGTLGLSALVLGLVLAFDVRGSARAYAMLTKDYKPLGIDYSQSMFSKPLFLRCFGGMFAFVGLWFIVGAMIVSSQKP